MTPDMKFVGLLVSEDFRLLRPLLETLDDCSIDVTACASAPEALDVLMERNFDLFLVDLDIGDAEQVLQALRSADSGGKTIVVGIVPQDMECASMVGAGAHVILRKPLGPDVNREFRDAVYSRMVRECRRHPRFAVNWLVAAKDANNNPVAMTLLDISEGGIKMLFTGTIRVGDLLNFRLLLPGTERIIEMDARVLWIERDNLAGSQFVRIAAADASTLREWLLRRYNGRNVEEVLPAVSGAGRAIDQSMR